jgi:ABC-type multidrug transport system ATPase subunit
LFDGTVAENIARFGEVDSDQVLAAAQAAGVHELILLLPKGYDTPLGDAGSALSGGQKQRIGLARASTATPLIVLDEPNSNLDDQGEAALAETIRRLKAKKRTVVIITHRLTTLAVADSILVMHEGTVKAHGPRDQVLAAMRSGNGPTAGGGKEPVKRLVRPPVAAAGAFQRRRLSAPDLRARRMAINMFERKKASDSDITDVSDVSDKKRWRRRASISIMDGLPDWAGWCWPSASAAFMLWAALAPLDQGCAGRWSGGRDR